ncbi:hypothetical protein V22_35100 [Calycomorphotria hydatis]|uniref:Uncharacterized protein n=1 Tax=Calycomorphotria hydatis TaxID=2528027 RepID=A0A517TCZ5_9PLAN|nr:hypothetical protein V22_35100 [Calycomorphotria hydatis]
MERIEFLVASRPGWPGQRPGGEAARALSGADNSNHLLTLYVTVNCILWLLRNPDDVRAILLSYRMNPKPQNHLYLLRIRGLLEFDSRYSEQESVLTGCFDG